MINEDDINNLVQAYKLLKYKFVGVFAADNFLPNLSLNSFIIENVSTSQPIGTHWTPICQKNGDYNFADPSGPNPLSQKFLHNRLPSSAGKLQTSYELIRNQPIKNRNSILYGLFCIYVAHWCERNGKDEWCWIDTFCASYDALTLLTWFDEISFLKLFFSKN